MCIIWHFLLIFFNTNNTVPTKISDTNNDDENIVIGLLFSTTGTSAILEECMLNAAIMAIDEINVSGGINGKKIVYYEEDYGSDPEIAQNKLEKLISEKNVIATIGCYTSASRKATLPLLKKLDSLLIYPTYTEGEEEAYNVIYTGAMPNQQSTDYILWLLNNCGKKVFLVGSDYVFPITCNKLAKIIIEKNGGTIVGEEYAPPGEIAFDNIIEKIEKSDANFIYCDLIGDSMKAFYKEYYNSNLTPQLCPIASITADEMIIQKLDTQLTEGHYTSMNYFSNIDTDKNKSFTQKYMSLYPNSSITCLAETTYTSVYLLKEAIEKLDSENISTNTPNYSSLLYEAFIGTSFDSPEGIVTVSSNHCLEHKSRFAVISNGSFNIIYESPQNIEPLPWLKLLTQ